MSERVVPLGDWIPDRADLDNPGLTVCENVIPNTDGYRHHPGPSPILNDELGSPYQGSIWALDKTNQRVNIVGGENGIWAFDRFQRRVLYFSSSPYFNLSSGWEFTRFIDHIIAVSYENRPQRIELTDGLIDNTNIFGLVDGLAPVAPRARRVATVGNHIVLGDTLNFDGSEGDTVGPNFVQWCGHRNFQIWGSSRRALSDFQPLEGPGGRVQKITGGTTGFIFQEHAIRAMTPIPAKAFKFQVLKKESGTDAPNSLASYEDTIFYYGWGDFRAFDTKSGRSEPISRGKISNWFKNDADISGLESMRGVVDRRARLVMWAYSTNALKSVRGYPYNDSILYYEIDTGRWSVARTDTRLLFEYYEKGYLLDELDDVFYPNGVPLSSMDISGDWLVDDPWMEANALQVAAFNKDDFFTSYTGSPLQHRFETGDVANDNNKRLYTNAVQPIYDGLSDERELFVQVGKRDKLSERPAWTDVKQVSTRNDRACVRANSKYQRVRSLGVASFKHAKSLRLYGHSKGGING